MSDWYTSGWLNFEVPWAPAAPLAPITLTSNQGSSASFTFKKCRNGWTYSGAPRTTLLGDGNGNMWVIGMPFTSSMANHGRPVAVAPASRTFAMFGWSIMARAWRSASKRASTCLVSR